MGSNLAFNASSLKANCSISFIKNIKILAYKNNSSANQTLLMLAVLEFQTILSFKSYFLFLLPHSVKGYEVSVSPAICM